MTAYSGSIPLLKKNDRLGSEVVDVHPAAEIIFHVREAVREA